MPVRPPRRVQITALLAATAAVGALTIVTPAQAVVGDTVADNTYTFTAKIDVGGERACTGTLVDAQYVLTASSCFAADGQPTFPIPAGAPAEKATATIGRTDLTGTAGKVVEITELVPRADRDLVMAKLATPVTDIAPVTLATTGPTAGETLKALGYGRTKDTWVPGRLHAGAFTVSQADTTTVAVTRDGGSICKGDAGGPALRETDGKAELVAVHSTSWQAGCLGSDETRPGAVETRLDDITEWIEQVRGLPREPQVVSGDFNGDGKEDVAAFYNNGTNVDGTNRASLFAFYSNGTGFAAPKKVWASTGSFSGAASKLTSGDYNGDGKDDLAVFYNSGQAADGKFVSTLFTFTSSGSGFNAPKKTWASTGSFNWSKSKLSSGDYNGDGKDDVSVFYDSGNAADGRFVSTLFTFTSTGTAFSNPTTAWTSSGSFDWSKSKPVSGDYNGDGKDDLATFYNGGQANDGKYVSLAFTFTSTGTAFNNPTTAWTSTGSFTWANSLVTSGDYNADGKTDLGVLYEGSTTADGRRLDSLFTFTSTGSALKAPVKHWTGSVV
ncbi:trypsin-like serine protease [Streptomyces sp. NPDC056930]|uniref:trypsin-like serine protease n=1 Tax=Streptomyces sp. NPDC056930 TaxID=3345967 RepID=UPI0036379226